MRYKAMFLAAVLVTTMSVAVPPAPVSWEQNVAEREPELAAIVSAALTSLPRWETYEGRPYADVATAVDKALTDARGNLSPDKASRIAEKLKAAYDAQPSDWEIVGMALKAAYYAKPDAGSLAIAERVVKTPPHIDYMDGILQHAMRLLAASGEKRYVDLVFECINDKQYLATLPSKRAEVATGAVAALETCPPEQARPYLEQLAQKYPYDEKTSPVWREDMPERQISCTIASALRQIEMMTSGATVKLGGTRP